MTDAREWFAAHPLAAVQVFLAFVSAGPDEARAAWGEMALDEALAGGEPRPDLIGTPAERDMIRGQAADAIARRYAAIVATDPDAATRYAALAADFAPGGPRGGSSDAAARTRAAFYSRHKLGASTFTGIYFGLGAEAAAMMFAVLGWDAAMENGGDVPDLMGSDTIAAALDIAGLDGLRQPGVTLQ